VENLRHCMEIAQMELHQKLVQCENIPGASILQPLHEKIHEVGSGVQQDLVDILSVEHRPLRAILVGPSNYGKTVLLSAMIGKRDTGTVQTDTAGWHSISSSLEILDIYGMKPNQPYPEDKAKELKSHIDSKHPDIALVVMDLSASRNWEWYTGAIEFILKLLPQNFDIYWVATKLDQSGELDSGIWKKGDDEGWAPWKARVESNYDAILKATVPKFSCFGEAFHPEKLAVTSVSQSGDVGVTWNGGLLDTINSKAPIYAQIVREGVTRYKAMRKAIATKIISAFVVINTVVGAMPIVDLILAPIVDYTMIGILQHLRTRRTRTAEKYRSRYLIKLAVGCAIRGVLLVAGLVAEMSLVFAVIGATSGAVITGGTTLALGYHSYEYFTADEGDSDSEEGEITEGLDLSEGLSEKKTLMERLGLSNHESDVVEEDILTDVSDSVSEDQDPTPNAISEK